jgi:DnaJ-domain-containing protein 1
MVAKEERTVMTADQIAAPFDAALAALQEAQNHYRATGLPWFDREAVTEDIRLAQGQIETQRRNVLRQAQLHAAAVFGVRPEGLTLVPGGAA